MPKEDTQFKPGDPRSGRPKGVKNKPKQADKIAEKLAKEQLLSLLGKATETIADDLDAFITDPETGEPKKNKNGKPIPDRRLRTETARFLINKVLPTAKPEETFIGTKLMTKLEQFSDLQEISKEAVLLLMDGNMSFEQVVQLQEIIQTHAGIEGYMKVEDLREELDRLANARTINGDKVIPEISRVTWGQGATHEGNSPDNPAE